MRRSKHYCSDYYDDILNFSIGNHLIDHYTSVTPLSLVTTTPVTTTPLKATVREPETAAHRSSNRLLTYETKEKDISGRLLNHRGRFSRACAVISPLESRRRGCNGGAVESLCGRRREALARSPRISRAVPEKRKRSRMPFLFEAHNGARMRVFDVSYKRILLVC